MCRVHFACQLSCDPRFLCILSLWFYLSHQSNKMATVMTIFLLSFAFLNVSNFVSITIKYESKLWNHLKEVVSWEYVFDLS